MTKLSNRLIVLVTTAVITIAMAIPSHKAYAILGSANTNTNTNASTNTQTQTNPTTTNTQTNTPAAKTIIPFTKTVDNTIPGLLSRAVNFLLGLIASVAVIFIIVGGFRLAFSQGNSEAVTAGKKTITWAIIGLVVALMSFAIIRIVEKVLYS